MVVSTILSLLVAIALPLYQGQQGKARDTDTKTKLTNLLALAKSEWTSNGQTFPAQVTLIASMAASAPQITVTGGSGFPANSVDVRRDSPNSVTLRTTSGSGERYAVRLITDGVGAGTYRTHGPSSSVGQTNFISNPSFEVDLSGWTTSGTTFAKDTSWSSSGVASVHMVRSVLTNDSSAFSPAFAVTAGQLYSGSYQLKIGSTNTASGTGPRLTFQWDDGTSSFSLGNSNSPAIAWPAVGATASVSYTATAPAGATQARLRLQGATTGTQVVDMYLDSVEAAQSSSVLPYFDGDYPGGAWIGTAHDSASTDYAWEGW